MNPELHEELKRLFDLGISISFNYDAQEWNVWHTDADKRWHSWGDKGVDEAGWKIINQIKQTAREILEIK